MQSHCRDIERTLDRPLIHIDMLDPAEWNNRVRMPKDTAHHAQAVGADLISARIVAGGRNTDHDEQRNEYRDAGDDAEGYRDGERGVLQGRIDHEAADEYHEPDEQRAQPHQELVIRMQFRELAIVVDIAHERLCLGLFAKGMARRVGCIARIGRGCDAACWSLRRWRALTRKVRSGIPGPRASLLTKEIARGF